MCCIYTRFHCGFCFIFISGFYLSSLRFQELLCKGCLRPFLPQNITSYLKCRSCFQTRAPLLIILLFISPIFLGTASALQFSGTSYAGILFQKTTARHIVAVSSSFSFCQKLTFHTALTEKEGFCPTINNFSLPKELIFPAHYLHITKDRR